MRNNYQKQHLLPRLWIKRQLLISYNIKRQVNSQENDMYHKDFFDLIYNQQNHKPISDVLVRYLIRR